MSSKGRPFAFFGTVTVSKFSLSVFNQVLFGHIHQKYFNTQFFNVISEVYSLILNKIVKIQNIYNFQRNFGELLKDFVDKNFKAVKNK